MRNLREDSSISDHILLKRAGPCGAPGHGSLSVQPPRPSLSSKGQVQTVANQGREGMQTQGKSSQETTVQEGESRWQCGKTRSWLLPTTRVPAGRWWGTLTPKEMGGTP